MKTYLTVFATVLAMSAADVKVITPPGAKPPTGPYSPAIFAGDFLYVSGQGGAKPDGSFPATAAEQVEQCLRNVQSHVEAAGLTMRHVVYAQLYLKDVSNYDEANRAWAKFFPADPPARATVGVARIPTDSPVEITVVAYRDLSRRKSVAPPGHSSALPVTPGVMAGDRLYLSGFLGAGPTPADRVERAFSQMEATLKAAGMDFRHVAFVNPYLTDDMPMDVMNRVYASKFEFGNTPGRATIRVASLPNGASIEFTGVAVKDLAQRRAVRPKNMAPSPTASPCVFAGDTFYCSAKSGFIPGPNSGIYASTTETQLRQTMRNLLDGLEEAGMDFSNVVAANVYLDDVGEWEKMNKVYAEYFKSAPPTRTTVQQYPALKERKSDSRGRWPTLEQISIIAVK
ncbi:MAG TPA: RidA family protein [Bryobacteraceae bacterium]|nr:RidA family protein [Bryobacteraceae bacterium]